MTINTIGHDLHYNVWLVAKLFFDENEAVTITSKAAYSAEAIHAEAVIDCDGRRETATHMVTCGQNADAHEKKRLTSAVCGMALYCAAQRLRPRRLPWGVMTGIRPAKPIRQLLCAGKPEEEILSYMQNLYGASEQKLRLALEVAKNELSLIAQNGKDDIGLYIGIPFCPTRCLYCSFVSTDLRRTKKYVPEYLRLLAQEIAHSARLTRATGKRVQSIYIGGGTPTSITAEELDFLLGEVSRHFDTNELYEYCVEAGRPDTITYEKLQVLKRHGVTRISINPQTMHASTLQLIGRSHTPEDIETAFSLARRVGFDAINADLIAGLPGETEADFQQTLCAIDRYEPENITVHTMSIKRGSALHESLSDYDLTNPNTVYNMLDLSQEFMAKTGRAPYYLYRQKNMLGNLENVGYSRAGHESIYNVNIMEEVQSILALGCGGSSKAVDSTGERIERVYNFKAPIEYIQRFDEILAKKNEFFSLLNSV